MATVLVVDDVTDLRLVVSQVLSQEGITVLEASSGAEAVQLLRENREIELVLLDLGLPDMSGFSVLSEARLLRLDHPRLRIAILTGSRDKGDVLKAVSLEADDYIIKPIDPSLFRAKIAKILGLEPSGGGFAALRCDFSAALAFVPISFHFHLTSISELGCTCESVNRFIVGANFSFTCQKMDEIIGEPGFVFRARVDESEPASKTSSRFVTRATFLGLPENLTQKIRKFAVANVRFT